MASYPRPESDDEHVDFAQLTEEQKTAFCGYRALAYDDMHRLYVNKCRPPSWGTHPDNIYKLRYRRCRQLDVHWHGPNIDHPLRVKVGGPGYYGYHKPVARLLLRSQVHECKPVEGTTLCQKLTLTTWRRKFVA